jgi:predicted ester cyclase
MHNQADAHKTIARRYIEEIWNQGRIERFGEFFAPDYEEFNYEPANAAGHCGMVVKLKQIMPDAVWTIERMTADDDSVVCELTLRGTHQAEFRGIAPIGNAIAVRAYRTLVFLENKIVRHSALLDTAELLKQMREQKAA